MKNVISKLALDCVAPNKSLFPLLRAYSVECKHTLKTKVSSQIAIGQNEMIRVHMHGCYYNTITTFSQNEMKSVRARELLQHSYHF